MSTSNEGKTTRLITDLKMTVDGHKEGAKNIMFYCEIEYLVKYGEKRREKRRQRGDQEKDERR